MPKIHTCKTTPCSKDDTERTGFQQVRQMKLDSHHSLCIKSTPNTLECKTPNSVTNRVKLEKKTLQDIDSGKDFLTMSPITQKISPIMRPHEIKILYRKKAVN